jgi:hypothetical protein
MWVLHGAGRSAHAHHGAVGRDPDLRGGVRVSYPLGVTPLRDAGDVRGSTPVTSRPDGPPPDPDDGPGDGHDVIAWILGPAARRYARSRLGACRLPDDDAAVDDAVAEAGCNVAAQMRSASGVRADHVRRYGTTVIRNVVSSTLCRQDLELPDDDDMAADREWSPHAEREAWVDRTPEADAPAVGDPVRVVAEALAGSRPAWQLAAVLAHLVFTIHPDDVPGRFPRPQAGATPEQARWWSALAAAGRADLFAGHDPDVAEATLRQRRRRAMGSAQALLDLVAAQVRLDASEL